MKLALDQDTQRHAIASYATGCVTLVDRRVLHRSCILSPKQVLDDWPPQSMAELSAEHLEPLLAMTPEIVILGSGRRQRFPPAELIALVGAHGIGLEVMDTGAACRTFNILTGEGRKVVAALMMIEA